MTLKQMLDRAKMCRNFDMTAGCRCESKTIPFDCLFCDKYESKRKYKRHVVVERLRVNP